MCLPIIALFVIGSSVDGRSKATSKQTRHSQKQQQTANSSNSFFKRESINTDPKYIEVVTDKLSQVTGIDIKSAGNLVDASSDMGDFMIFSGMLRRLAVKLGKIANDLRLLSSGPRGGLNDINLPAVQPGSSM